MGHRCRYLFPILLLAVSFLAASPAPNEPPPTFVLTSGFGVDDGTDELQVCTSDCQNGLSGNGYGQFTNPRGITVESTGKVYVSDSENHRIQKLDDFGNMLNEWGSNGTGAGQFISPLGVTCDPIDMVYVADTNSHRIQKFDTNGGFLLMYGWGVDDGTDEFQICTSNCQAGIPGSGDGQFNYPYDVAADAAGNVYVVDADNRRIQKFDGVGYYLTQWGTVGNSESQFINPFSVDIDTSGNVYVSDSGNRRIQKFDSSGSFLLMWGWGVDDGTAEFQTCTGGCQAGINGSGDGQFDYPYGLAVDTAGNVYVVGNGNNRIQKFDSNGRFLTKWGASGNNEGQFNAPYAMAVGPRGNIWVADNYNHRIQRFLGPLLEVFVGEPELPDRR